MFCYCKYTSILLLILVSCSELFFPETGVPFDSSSRRSTPEDVKNQLIEGYEMRRIELIEELLADSFQFYVAPSASSYLDYNSEPPDTSMEYIDKNKISYSYWNRKDELYRTKRMFEHTVSSQFSPRPYISSVRYIIQTGGDTTAAEFILSNGILALETDKYGMRYADIDKQVFLLSKDGDGLWVIRKWYDLSNSESM